MAMLVIFNRNMEFYFGLDGNYSLFYARYFLMGLSSSVPQKKIEYHKIAP